MSNILETLHHGCVACGIAFKPTHRLCSMYRAGEVGSFENQIELGIIGAEVRNYWTHVYCHDPALREVSLKPDIHYCIECKQALAAKDMVIPVFGVEDPRAINPLDPTDVGLALSERVYFIHGDCRNKQADKHRQNILHV